MNNNVVEAGVDEAGRGPGLGRLYTASVIWKKVSNDSHSEYPRDSKTISQKQMKSAYDYVIDNAVAYHIDYASEEEIEEGILKANMNSMHRSIAGLQEKGHQIEHLLIDGNYFTEFPGIHATTVVKGDSKYYSIAAASILAKFTRDKYIDELCDKYPELDSRYGIRKNKGYLSQRHRDGIKKHGYCQFHRRTWKTFIGIPFNPVGDCPSPDTASSIS